ncbi:MAG: tetratricopeptide repeat protein [Proteobacteria bacterium]|nr:tetratricopeptide repeat protein [Pseudomonadota bacterium]
MIMRVCHRPWIHARRRAVAIAALAAVLAPLAVPAAAPARVDGNAAVNSAEQALMRGDCGVASRLYQQASQALEQPELAERASAVSLACGQYAIAHAIAESWLQFSPRDTGAMLALTQAELGNYQIAEARRHFRDLLADGGKKVAESIDAVVQRVGSEPTLAMLRELDAAPLRGADAQLELGALALDGWDAALALRYAQGARSAGASVPAAALITARAEAILGNAAGAEAAAKQAAAVPGGRLALAQSLLVLGDDSAAQHELERLRSDPEAGGAAARLLAQAAMESADYAVAEQRCQALINDPNSAPLAVFYLGLIAERRGDDAVAMRDYSLLAGSGFEPQARRRVAAILYKQGERDAAVRVLNAARDAEPDERIRSELAAADLLSVSGAADEAISRIDSALKRSPGNPEIAYQRAVLLERAGRVDAAIAQLESLHRARPLDAGVTNALGYTLADHKRELPRAEQLIRAALATQPDNPALLDSLGWVLHRRGQSAAAVAPLARAFRLLHDGDIGAHWGEVLWTAGQKAEARAAWQRALAADPDNVLLGKTVSRFAPTLKAPKPPPALEPAPRTSI